MQIQIDATSISQPGRQARLALSVDGAHLDLIVSRPGDGVPWLITATASDPVTFRAAEASGADLPLMLDGLHARTVVPASQPQADANLAKVFGEPVFLFTDGASRGNPGPSSSAAILATPEGAVIDEKGVFLGRTTNNFAEWTALLHGVRLARQHRVEHLQIRMDSELVVKQLKGEYQVRDTQLLAIYNQVIVDLRTFAHWDVQHIRRKENRAADALCNRVLDQSAA